MKGWASLAKINPVRYTDPKTGQSYTMVFIFPSVLNANNLLWVHWEQVTASLLTLSCAASPYYQKNGISQEIHVGSRGDSSSGWGPVELGANSAQSFHQTAFKCRLIWGFNPSLKGSSHPDPLSPTRLIWFMQRLQWRRSSQCPAFLLIQLKGRLNRDSLQFQLKEIRLLMFRNQDKQTFLSLNFNLHFSFSDGYGLFNLMWNYILLFPTSCLTLSK